MIYRTENDTAKYIYLTISNQLISLEPMFVVIDMDAEFKYSYSFDDINFNEEYNSVNEMIFALNSEDIQYTNLYIRVKLTCSNTNNLDYGSFVLNDIFVNNLSCPVTGIESIQQTNNILQNNITGNLFNPYRGMDNALELQKKLSYSVSQMFGFEFIYFRTEPDEDSKSVTFKSYRLSNVIEQKNVKININNNDLPDNRLNNTEWDIDFFDQLEVHIDIREFDNKFNLPVDFDAQPSSDSYTVGIPEKASKIVPIESDYVFLPLTNRMYQINTVNEVKGFMHRSTYYHAILTKWEDRADVVENSKSSKTIIDDLEDYIGYVDAIDSDILELEQTESTKSFNEPSTILPVIDESIDNFEQTLRYMFNFRNNNNTETPFTREFVEDDEFSVYMWFSTNELISHNVFDIVDSNNLPIFTTSIKDKKIEVNYSNRLQGDKVLMVPTGTLLEDTKYCVVMNYAYSKGRLLSISVLDESFNIIQENFIQNIDKIVNTKYLRIYGDKLVGNIRVRKTIINRNEMVEVIKDLLPDATKHFIIQNASPQLETDIIKTR